MFTNISWGNYIIVIILLVVSWYLFVGLRFYFDDLKEIITGKRKHQFQRLAAPSYGDFQSELNDQDVPKVTTPPSAFGEFDNTFQEIDILIEQLKSIITDADKRKLLKQELLDSIQLVLTAYPTVKKSPFNSSVTEFIVTTCNKIESITITQKEAEELWDKND